MKAEDIIRAAEIKAAEWMEMSKDPQQVLIWVLAKDIVKLKEEIDFLERIAAHVR